MKISSGAISSAGISQESSIASPSTVTAAGSADGVSTVLGTFLVDGSQLKYIKRVARSALPRREPYSRLTNRSKHQLRVGVAPQPTERVSKFLSLAVLGPPNLSVDKFVTLVTLATPIYPYKRRTRVELPLREPIWTPWQKLRFTPFDAYTPPPPANAAQLKPIRRARTAEPSRAIISRRPISVPYYAPPPPGTEYVSKFLDLVVLRPPDLSVDKFVSLAVLTPPDLSVTKTLELVVLTPPDLAVSKFLNLVVIEAMPTCGPIPVFPTLPWGFPARVTPTMKTTINTSRSGRESRSSNQSYSLWRIELPFAELRDKTQNQTAYAQFSTYTEFEQLCQTFLSMYGQFGLFYFDAPWDDSRTDQTIGTGDGTTTAFTAYRTWGTGTAVLAEPVGGINTITNVKVADSVVSSSTYSFSGNTLTFTTPPANGATITMTFSFYYLCRFIDDKQQFEEFAKNRWTVPDIKFRSVIWPAYTLQTITMPNP